MTLNTQYTLLEPTVNGQYLLPAPEQSQKIKIVMIGASFVGKTSILEQFVYNKFNEDYHPTKNRSIYYPSIILNDHVYNANVVDCPIITRFPPNSLVEWSEYPGYGLRNASGYVFVYDVTSDSSFQYIRMLKEQIFESRNMHDIPIIVAANKMDLADEKLTKARRDVANTIKKAWRCPYIELSAKYNWHVVTLFRELMKLLDMAADNRTNPGGLYTMRMRDTFRYEKCTIC